MATTLRTPVESHPPIGAIEPMVLNKRIARDDSAPEGQRVHSYLSFSIGDFEHTGWYTPAVESSDTGITIVNKTGLGEIVSDGIGWDLHRYLTRQLPAVDVFTHETEGVGHYARTMNPNDLWHHGIDQMALNGLTLMERFCSERRVLAVGTSLSTIVFNKLLNLNLDQGRPVDIIGGVYYASALVDPANIVKDMALLFVPELAVDIVQELAFRTNPIHLFKLLKRLVASRPKANNLLPMTRQSVDVIKGVKEEEIRRVTENYDIAVITGTNDSLSQLPMWHRLADGNERLSVHPVRGRGHGMTIKTKEAATKIRHTIVERGFDIAS